MQQPYTRLVSGLTGLTIGLTACGVAIAAGSPHSPKTPAGPGTCPLSAPIQIATARWPAARRVLAPPGATAIRLCRYSGLNAHPPRQLVRSVLLGDRAAVASLVRRFDSLPTAAGTFSCPLDDGSEIVALLSYPHAQSVAISVGLRGCQTVTNGTVRRTAAGAPGQPGPALVAQLQRLTA